MAIFRYSRPPIIPPPLFFVTLWNEGHLIHSYAAEMVSFHKYTDLPIDTPENQNLNYSLSLLLILLCNRENIQKWKAEPGETKYWTKKCWNNKTFWIKIWISFIEIANYVQLSHLNILMHCIVWHTDTLQSSTTLLFSSPICPPPPPHLHLCSPLQSAPCGQVVV